MSGLQVEFGSDWDVVERAFATLEGDELYAVLEAGAEVVLARAGELIPVDTGELKGTLVIEREDNMPLVGAGTEHAEPVEFGTSKMAAQPYLRPAMDESEPIQAAMEQALAETLERRQV